MASSAFRNSLYAASTLLKACALRIAGLWSSAVRKGWQARKGWRTRLAKALATNPKQPTLWCHLSATDDIAQCAPLIANLKKAHPSWNYLLTLQPLDRRIPHGLSDCFTYTDTLPLDTPSNAKRFLKLVAPTAAVIVRRHGLGNFLIELHKNNTPTYLIAAQFNARSTPFRWFRPWQQRWFSLYTWIFTVNSTTVDLLSHHGITHVTCAGDTQFDSIALAQSNAQPIRAIELLTEQDHIIVAAYTTPKDEAALVALVWNLPPQWHLVVQPNTIDEERIANWVARLNRSVCRTAANPSCEELRRSPLLLLDAQEEPLDAYRYASIAYVGGGFENQLADVMEPAAYGKPIIFGAMHHNRPSALELREHNAAAVAYAPTQLARICLNLIANTNIRTQMGQRAYNYFAQRVGCTDTILRRIEADTLLASTPFEST